MSTPQKIYVTGEVVFRPFERTHQEDVTQFVPLFWEYWLKVNGEDTSNWIEVDALGVKIPLPQCEANLYAYLQRGYQIQIAEVRGAPVGFLLYHRVCDWVLEVRHMYLEPGYVASGLGVGLVQSLGFPVKKIIFQTRVEAPPRRFLETTKNYRREIARTEKLITWEMEWTS